LPEVEVDLVKVQQKKQGTVMVTIPIDVVKKLKLRKTEKLKVYFDQERRRIVYEVMRKV
jgi:antitoxin component of MazEF toxin-antitoxin module